MNLLDLYPELVNMIVSFLDPDKQLQLNRVSKYFNIELSKEQFVEYVKNKLETDNFDYEFEGKLQEQIKNPLWIQKYGLYPLPICHTNLFITPLLDAFKNSDFKTIRTILLLDNPNYISFICDIQDYQFVNKHIRKGCTHVLFRMPWMYAHKFGCSMEVCKQIYNLMEKLVKAGYAFETNYKRFIEIRPGSLENGHFDDEMPKSLRKELFCDLDDEMQLQKEKFKDSYINADNNIYHTFID